MTSRVFLLFQICNVFSVLSIFKQDKIGETNNELVKLSNNFYPVVSHRKRSKRKRRIIVYGLVTRYGPQSPAQVANVVIEIWNLNPFICEIFNFTWLVGLILSRYFM